jgi:ATP-dependent Clp protease ATP-binding subunit ClpA
MPTLGSLIEEVESAAPSHEPLDLLATASATVQTINELTDSVLSHFVDRCRRAGHSWAEIGTALGVTKQAVQKRFTSEPSPPPSWDRFTPRAVRVIEQHAPAAATELGHNYIGTEHLLLGLHGEPEGIAARILVSLGLDRPRVVSAIEARVERASNAPDPNGPGGFTPRAWAAIASCVHEALMMGHNYIGTEHQLLALMGGVGGMGAEILADAGIERDKVRAEVVKRLAGVIVQKK